VGCHSVIHSMAVVRAWHHLYGTWPKPWELGCIVIHDIGHLGKQYLDNLEDKKAHYVLGAKIARKLFGEKGEALVAGHCEYSGFPLSRLYRPDKYAMIYTTYWWSSWNCLMEPRLKGTSTMRHQYEWLMRQVHHNIDSGEYKSGHSMYLERERANARR
jgi:hypothetical protein